MKHWTRLGWTNVNAIEVQEFGGILPCVREEEGLMDFSRQRKSLEKGWPARPPRGKNRNISIYDQITMCLLTTAVFQKMNSCKGYICWASLPGLPIESDGFLALERKSHIGKSLTHWPCGKKRNHVDVDEDDDNEKGIWHLPVKSPPTEALLPLHAPHFSTAAKSWGKIFLEIFSRSFSVDTKLVLSESKWYEMKMITFVTSARSALF